MKINESEALAIAKQFVLDEHEESEISVNAEEFKIILESGGFGHTVLGLNYDYWSITFMLKNNNNDMLVFDPDYYIVLVDAESGEPNWLPVM
jgi:hypothetical protein